MKIYTDELKSADLRFGDKITLSGTVYTARDAAHKQLRTLLRGGEALPFEIKNAVIYYAGPTEASPGLPVGSCGPTTSSRMDVYAPELLDLGLAAMIGKGDRNKAVEDAVTRNGAVYLCAVGGCGALACERIRSLEVIAFPQLGCESVKRLVIEDFPLIVSIDSQGGNIFREGRKKYFEKIA